MLRFFFHFTLQRLHFLPKLQNQQTQEVESHYSWKVRKKLSNVSHRLNFISVQLIRILNLMSADVGETRSEEIFRSKNRYRKETSSVKDCQFCIRLRCERKIRRTLNEILCELLELHNWNAKLKTQQILRILESNLRQKPGIPQKFEFLMKFSEFLDKLDLFLICV